MQQKTRTFALDVKELKPKGSFTGYLSVFDAIDSYREVVAPGAFTRTLEAWAAKGRMPPLLWQHRAGEPIGPFTKMEQDDKGLYVEAQLLVDDVQRAREAWALLKAKVISGMSIGFNVMPDGEEYDSRAGIVILKELDLWEGSLATFPACEEAQVDSVKSRSVIDRIRSVTTRGALPTVRDFEDAMRDVFAFSRSDAKALAALCIGQLQRDVDSSKATGTGDTSETLVLDAVRNFPKFNFTA